MKSVILRLWTINELYKVSIIWFMTTNNILVQIASCIFIWNSGVLLKYRHVNYLSPINTSLESHAMNWENLFPKTNMTKSEFL